MDSPLPSSGQRLALASLVARYATHEPLYTDPSTKYSEHSCRTDFIDQFLELLGWDVTNRKGVAPQYREVIAEGYVEKTGRPDYTMAMGGQPQFFIEAKAPSKNILRDPEPSLQARRYGWNAGHGISVLTNFEDLAIFDTTVMPRGSDGPATARLLHCHFTDYVDRFDEIFGLLSRESVFSGHFRRFMEGELHLIGTATERIDQVFLEQINGWRLRIARSLLTASDRYRDEDLLNDAIQAFVDQIVFLRICEDRNLPTYHRLYELDDIDVGASILELLRKADARYDSGLFSETSAIAHIDDSVIKDIVEALYYPQSPYLFDIIDPNIFGQIYEMFLSEYVMVDDEGAPRLALRREYADRSVVATPVPVARSIVERTLEPLCEGKSPDQILALSCADIACGSGIFLLESYQYLMNASLDWLYSHERDRLIPLEGGRYKLPFELKRDLLSSCIYGVDIDVHAVEIAKFSLLIKLIEDERASTVSGFHPILPNLDANVMVGNSLVSPEEARELGASEADLETMAPFDWTLIHGGASFDAIVGNPPYVKTEDLHRLLPKVEIEVYRKFYRSAFKQFDKYFLFIERALDRVVVGGYVCLIVPNKFYKIQAGKRLRELIAEGRYLVSLDDFGDAQLFDGKITYSSILLLRRTPQDTFVYSIADSADRAIGGDASESAVFDATYLGGDVWKLTTDPDQLSLLEQLRTRAVPITKYLEFFNGIQTSAERNRTYWFARSELVREDDGLMTFSRDGREWAIERDILRPYFKPTDRHGFNSYSDLDFDKWLIFPYDRYGRLIPIATMKERYPFTWDYLLSKKAELWPRQLEGSGRRDVPGATPETWYQYGRDQHLSTFNEGEKLIIGVLSKEPLYYIDRDGWVVAAGGTAGYCAARARPGSPYSLEYMQAWLSNGNTERLFAMIGSDFEGGYKSRGTSLLNMLPFIELNFDDAGDRALYREVNNLARRVRRINEELRGSISHRRSIVLTRQKEEAIRRIEDLIDRVYNPRIQE